MITEKIFKKSVKALSDYHKWEDKLEELGINIWEVDEVIELKRAFEELLAYTCKDTSTGPYPNLLEYFLYDFCIPGIPENIPAEDLEIKDENDLWNIYIKRHPEIVEESKKDIPKASSKKADEIATLLKKIQKEAE